MVAENYGMSLRDTKDLNKWKVIPCHGLEDSICYAG